jgi:hypothetical protein
LDETKAETRESKKGEQRVVAKADQWVDPMAVSMAV